MLAGLRKVEELESSCQFTGSGKTRVSGGHASQLWLAVHGAYWLCVSSANQAGGERPGLHTCSGYLYPDQTNGEAGHGTVPWDSKVGKFSGHAVIFAIQTYIKLCEMLDWMALGLALRCRREISISDEALLHRRKPEKTKNDQSKGRKRE